MIRRAVAFVLTALLGAAAATIVLSRLEPDSGGVVVGTPEIYTRERLVNDRLDHVAWIDSRLRELEEKPETFRSQIVETQMVAEIVARLGTGENKPEQGPLRRDEKLTGAEAAHREPTLDLFHQMNRYRSILREERTRAMLDDRHDIDGSTLLQLNLDATVLPPARRIVEPVRWSRQILGRSSKGHAAVVVKVEREPFDAERNGWALYRDWAEVMQREIDFAIFSRQAVLFDHPVQAPNRGLVELLQSLRIALCAQVLTKAGAQANTNQVDVLARCLEDWQQKSLPVTRADANTGSYQDMTLAQRLRSWVKEAEEAFNRQARTHHGEVLKKLGKDQYLEALREAFVAIQVAARLRPADEARRQAVQEAEQEWQDAFVRLFGFNALREHPACKDRRSHHLPFALVEIHPQFQHVIKYLEALRATSGGQVPMAVRLAPFLVPARSDTSSSGGAAAHSGHAQDLRFQPVPVPCPPSFGAVEEAALLVALIREVRNSPSSSFLDDHVNRCLTFDHPALRRSDAESEVSQRQARDDHCSGSSSFTPLRITVDRGTMLCAASVARWVELHRPLPTTGRPEEGLRLSDLLDLTIVEDAKSGLGCSLLVSPVRQGGPAGNPILRADKLMRALDAIHAEVFAYGLTPRAVTEVVSTSQREAFDLLVAASRAIRDADAQIGRRAEHALRRHRSPAVVVSFTLPPEERSERAGMRDAGRDISTTFGWVFSAPTGDDDPDMQLHNLGAMVSIPSWWRGLRITTIGCWLAADEPARDLIAVTEWARRRADTPTRTTAYASVTTGAGHADPLPPNCREHVHHVRVPGGTSEFLRALRLEIIQTPYLRPSNPTRLSATVGRGARFLLQGGRLWRSPVVTLGGQPADRVRILPDMMGIVAEFECVEEPNEFEPREPASAHGGPSPMPPVRPDWEGHREWSVPLRIFTSEGTTQPIMVHVIAPPSDLRITTQPGQGVCPKRGARAPAAPPPSPG